MDQIVEAKTSAAIANRSHRPDIDVLRAIAVAAVVLFHLGWTTVSGGFVGVDVFFVISGYLISRIIWTESAQSRFSLANFYARRARRLLPALSATVVASFIVGAFLLIPEQFQELSRSALFSLLGLANFDFWMQSGYFDSSAIQKPLLHIWTLAVELQFYAFWPFLIAATVRKTCGTAFGLIAAALVVSLGGCPWMMNHDPTAAFFLVPFRVWEFAAGGLVFLIERLDRTAAIEGLCRPALCRRPGRDTLFRLHLFRADGLSRLCRPRSRPRRCFDVARGSRTFCQAHSIETGGLPRQDQLFGLPHSLAADRLGSLQIRHLGSLAEHRPARRDLGPRRRQLPFH